MWLEQSKGKRGRAEHSSHYRRNPLGPCQCDNYEIHERYTVDSSSRSLLTGLLYVGLQPITTNFVLTLSLLTNPMGPSLYAAVGIWLGTYSFNSFIPWTFTEHLVLSQGPCRVLGDTANNTHSQPLLQWPPSSSERDRKSQRLVTTALAASL